MPHDGTLPAPVLPLAAGLTVFMVMFALGLGVKLREFTWIAGRPGLLLRALFAVFVAVPAVAVCVARALELSRAAEIGLVLMAISPGAPIALRRSLDAGAHRAFAPALQILVALLAVVSMPLSIAALDVVYAGDATIAPLDLARQVFVAQLLPLALGIALHRVAPSLAARLQPPASRAGTLMLAMLIVLAVIDVAAIALDAGWRNGLAIVLVTALALAMGHRMGGPEPATRAAVAVTCAARNAGLALVVATLNHAAPAIGRMVLVYLLISAFVISAYVAWRRRAGGAGGTAFEGEST